MRRRPSGALGVVLALTAVGLIWSLPASSQTDSCNLTEAYQAGVGGGAPVVTDTTPYISFTTDNPSSVAFPVDSTHAVFCDATGQDRNLATGALTSWTVPSGTPASGQQHTAPSGSIVQGIVVRAQAIDTTTTSTSTSSTSSTSSTAPTTTTTTASTTTTSSTSTTTTTTLPRGPGNGAIAVRPENGVDRGVDAAAVRGNDRVDVVTDRNGTLNETAWTGSGWTGYTDLGNPPSGTYQGDPTIVSWAPGRLDVFVRGADNKLWQRFSTDAGQTWSDWVKPVGDDGTLASSPDASTRGAGRLEVFVLGTNGRIYQRFYDGAWNDTWLDQGAPGAVDIAPGSHPTAVSRDGVRVDIFVRSFDNRLWQKSWDGTQWSDWFRPVGASGTLASSPDVASWDDTNLVVFTLGTDGHLWALPFGTGGWGDWVRLAGSGDVFVDNPGATSRGLNRFDVFGRGTDGLLYQIWQ